MTSEARGNGVLWFAIAGGPVAWSVDTLAAVAIDHDYCAHGPTGTSASGVTLALLGIAIVAATITLLAGAAGVRYLGSAGTDTGLGDTDADRRRFMARSGVVISLLALFGIVLRLITVLFLSPSAC